MIDTDHNQNSPFNNMPESSDPTAGFATNLAMHKAVDKLNVLEQFNQPNTARELPRYQCHKKVWALKIDAIHLDSDVAKLTGRETTGGAFIYPEDKNYSPFQVDYAYVTKHKPEAGGYYVVYDDGYKSFSPAAAFENGYTKL